ncbi:MAG: YdcF family protein [Dolichospermum sp.]
MACILSLFTFLTYKNIQESLIQPQAILVLGGSTSLLEREKFTAKLAREYPDMPIWISGGSPPQHTKKIFTNAGIDPRRLNLDYEAVDTVTNFTTLVDELRSHGIKSIYLITSDFHMLRACVIGEIVLGSRGINFKPVSVPSKNSPEPIEKSIRDGARAVMWVATGYTGANDAKNKVIPLEPRDE